MTFSVLCPLQFHQCFIFFIVGLFYLICWSYPCVILIGTVNQIAILISISDISVPIHSNAIGFCMLILYLLPLLNSFVSPNNFWVGRVWGLQWMLISPSKRVFSALDAFYSFFLWLHCSIYDFQHYVTGKWWEWAPWFCSRYPRDSFQGFPFQNNICYPFIRK